ncbi:MAG: 50S ribosomal protein L35 [Candidatus Kerfeldbacteria bacterium]|nr:50S ribosomal protein L35 [Candidatus Kerfeldbacteria bacterium]
MPKLKTHKATAKRIKQTGSGRLIRRTAGQDHFNSRESGVVTRRKRRDQSVAATEAIKSIKQLTPYR